MKKMHPQSGPGNRAIDNLLEAMVSRSRGHCVKKADGLRLTFSDRPDEFVAYAPADQEAWITRLKWIEKHSAIFLLNAPILYGIKWPVRSRRSSGKKTLRLSVGLSLSVGFSLPKRYTCILNHGEEQATVFEGGYLAVGRSWGESLLVALPKWAEGDLGKMAHGVLKACEYFEARSEVRKAILAMGEKRREELTHLEHLYRRKQGSNDRLYGLRVSGTEGSRSIEAELSRLQITVLDRYSLKLRVRYLSLGVLEGDVPREICKTGGSTGG